MTRVRLDGVEKTYRRSGPHVRALAGVSLDVAPGATLAVLGPSGCGKTTLLRAVAGLEAVDAGRVRFGERDVTADPPERRRAGFVFANDALFPHRDVAANIAYGIADAAGREHGVRDCAERMRVADLLRRRPATLSAGQRQRVALARALAAAPQVLLLDEPFSRLDAPLRAELRVELGALLRDARTTTLVVTHDQSEAMALGDRVVVMRDGAVEQSGTPRDLYDRPSTTFVARFVGSPAMALVPASAFGARASVSAATASSSAAGKPVQMTPPASRARSVTRDAAAAGRIERVRAREIGCDADAFARNGRCIAFAHAHGQRAEAARDVGEGRVAVVFERRDGRVDPVG